MCNRSRYKNSLGLVDDTVLNDYLLSKWKVDWNIRVDIFERGRSSLKYDVLQQL